jgi:hypothetical protein
MDAEAYKNLLPGLFRNGNATGCKKIALAYPRLPWMIGILPALCIFVSYDSLRKILAQKRARSTGA